MQFTRCTLVLLRWTIQPGNSAEFPAWVRNRLNPSVHPGVNVSMRVINAIFKTTECQAMLTGFLIQYVTKICNVFQHKQFQSEDYATLRQLWTKGQHLVYSITRLSTTEHSNLTAGHSTGILTDRKQIYSSCENIFCRNQKSVTYLKTLTSREATPSCRKPLCSTCPQNRRYLLFACCIKSLFAFNFARFHVFVCFNFDSLLHTNCY